MENFGLGAGLAALAFWGFVAAVVVAGIWDGIRKRETQHETLRRMLESDKPVDQELMDKILGSDDRLDLDLKVAGLITLFVAPGLALLGWFLSMLNAKVLLPLLGVAALVGLVSIGLLVASKSIERSYREEKASAPGHRSV
jgi:hypothetical protein